MSITPENVLGVLSLIVWTLVIVVTLKYLVYVLNADNRGEGGILALLSLVRGADGRSPRGEAFIVAIGLFGAALLYGDGALTPAISVLSALEGLKVATPGFEPFVVPATVVVLIGLFLVQRKGTASVGMAFGPVIVFWFFTLGALGLNQVVRDPSIFAAVNPIYALRFLIENGISGYLVLGSVFLVTTGGEALYADLGHFGPRPIRIGWFAIVAPMLVLHYFGQGALLLHEPEAAHDLFYRMAPAWGLYPLVALATVSTVMASQAVISGVFSLTRQAVQLGFAPRVQIVHTSSREIGQIYIPGANWGLMVGTLALVLQFQTSGNLAAAYGMAVTTTMIVTTILAHIVARRLWNWSLPRALCVTGAFLIGDMAFFGANLIKISHGGWIPLVIGALGFLIFATWQRGRALVAQELARSALPLDMFLADLEKNPRNRVPGTAVFLNSSANTTPIALLHNIKLNHVLHEHNVILNVVTEEFPFVSSADRISIESLAAGFSRVVVRYGFMEDPDIPAALAKASMRGLAVDPARVTYMLSSNTLIPKPSNEMNFLRKRLFSFLSRNALRPSLFFRLPLNRVLELGVQIKI